MIERLVAGIVDGSRRFAGIVILLGLLASILAGVYATQHFAINTNVTDLLDASAGWRQREIAFSKAFPQRDDLLVVVIDGANATDTDLAARDLTAALTAKPDLFKTVYRPEANPYFQQHGLLLLGQNELADTMDGILRAQPLLASLGTDPSPRGLFEVLTMMLMGVEYGQAQPEDIAPFLSRVNASLKRALDDPNNPDAWAYLLASEKPSKFELRRFMMVQPVLDYSALSPGAAASSFIRDVVSSQKIAEKYNVTVRLTGSVALSDDEFASVSEGMGVAMFISVVLIYLILFGALRSWRLIIPIFITLFAGLAITMALALLMVKSLNLISVAFIVMFTGIAVDFGIQFGVRYRDARVQINDLAGAMKQAASIIAIPLLLAALSTAAAFFSFIPTSYRGVAELGLIAGSGMLVAFILNITLLPAMLRFTQPGPEHEAPGFRWAAGIDTYLLTHRRTVLTAFTIIFVVCGTLASFLRFDFDPLNLKDKKVESVLTMFDLIKDPDSSPYTIDILTPNLEAAEALAAKIQGLPQVDKVITLRALVPDEQDEKIALITETASLLGPALNSPVQPTPTLEEAKASATELAEKLKSIKELGPEAEALVQELTRFAALDQQNYATLAASMQKQLGGALDGLRQRLAPKKVTLEDIPADLKAQWVAADGQARIEIMPKGDAHDHNVLIAYVDAVRGIAPEATGAPISIQESAKTIKQAFVEAAIYSAIMIFVLLLVLLRSLTHTLYVLAPLILAFVLTLGTATLVNLPINFANIISLPLLLGLGVSYSIYFVVYWVQGFTNPLQSSMARAVLSSAATTLVAFGSLSVSNHPGTASMGLLLALSLFYVLFTTFLFLPSLLGNLVKSRTK